MSKPVAIGPTSRTVIGASVPSSPKPAAATEHERRKTLQRLAIYAGIGGLLYLAMRSRG